MDYLLNKPTFTRNVLAIPCAQVVAGFDFVGDSEFIAVSIYTGVVDLISKLESLVLNRSSVGKVHFAGVVTVDPFNDLLGAY